MKIKILASVCLWGIVMAMSSCNTGSAPEKNEIRPNILYIFTDDQTIRTLGSYDQSHQWVHTPNIDRLASHGARHL